MTDADDLRARVTALLNAALSPRAVVGELRALLAATDPAPDEAQCVCEPCPGRGYDGHGMLHCAECCFGSGVEADLDCPTHGDPAHAAPTPPTVAPSDLPVATGDASSEGGCVPCRTCGADQRAGWCRHPAPVHADDTDTGDEGVRLTASEKDALARKRNRNGGALFETVETIVAHRLAALRTRAEVAEFRASAAEARLGEGVVTLTRLIDYWETQAGVDRDMESKTLRGVVAHIRALLNTSPWVEVSEP